MTLLLLLLGITLPASVGWMLLRVIEGTKPVLGRMERILWALVLGQMLHALLMFISNALLGIPLTLFGFFLPLLCLGIPLGVLVIHRGMLRDALPHVSACTEWRKYLTIPLLLLILWSGLKIAAGAYDLAIVPTYWDDSFNNWNMRAKVFWQHHDIMLEIPGGNGITIGAYGVNSYPPSLPLIKTWLVSLRGSWSDALVNGIHPLWLLCSIGIIGCALRRLRGNTIALIGMYMTSSLPLLLLHGMNPYADAMVSAHLTIATIAVLRLITSEDHDQRRWQALAGISIGLLLFTKNEATVLYAPMLVVAYCIDGVRRYDWKHAGRLLLPSLIIGGVIIAPWLLFKWGNGLTFGNAKALQNVSFAWSTEAAQALWFQLTREPNFLLLPIVTLFTLLLRRHRLVSQELFFLSVFIILTLALQWLLFCTVRELATEAIRQTGTSRGMIHLAPLVILMIILAWTDASKEHAPESTGV